MLAVLTWKWGRLFGPEYVNRLRSSLARNLRIPHVVYCITDDWKGIDDEVCIVPPWGGLEKTPRCRRRMLQYDAETDKNFGSRLLSIDLDVVIVDDITPLVARADPVVMWRVGYADVLSGSFVLWKAGALDGAWRAFQSDPDGYPREASPRGIGSDQAMLNYWLAGRRIAEWKDSDGFVPFFGNGYARFEHLGVSERRPELPQHAKVIVLGSADKAVLDEGRFAWAREHWR